MNNPWRFEADQLKFTPSFKDGISNLHETVFREEGIKFIQKLANELKLHFTTLATGAVFFHRFYMYQSFKMFPIYPMAATCLFLAGKVEETPKKSEHIITISRSIITEQQFAQFGPDPKEEMLTLERILLQTLRFDLEIEHPYTHLLKYIKHCRAMPVLNLTEDNMNEKILQDAWTFVNTSFYTTLCLQFEPELIAIGMIFLTCKTSSTEIIDWRDRLPEHKNWWDAYVENLTVETLEDMSHRILDCLERNRPVENEHHLEVNNKNE